MTEKEAGQAPEAEAEADMALEVEDQDITTETPIAPVHNDTVPIDRTTPKKKIAKAATASSARQRPR